MDQSIKNPDQLVISSVLKAERVRAKAGKSAFNTSF